MDAELNLKDETGQPLQPESIEANGIQTGDNTPADSSENQTLENDETEKKKSGKYPFGPGVFTNDKGLINEYLQLAYRHFGNSITQKPIVEQFYILYHRVNKFICVLQLLKDGGWRGCSRVINIACNEYLSNGLYSKNEKKQMSDINVFLSDMMFMLLENRICFSVVYKNYLHHQKQLSHILRKKPETIVQDGTEGFNVDVSALGQSD